MTAFYICAILVAPMLFMGMIPSARAEDVQQPLTDEAIGPGAYTYPPHPHATLFSSSDVCQKPSDWETCHKDENIVCGYGMGEYDLQKDGPGASGAQDDI